MKLTWLNDAPKTSVGVNWGVPWKKGKLLKSDSVNMGKHEIESWPMAFWPDGSIKWTGHTGVFNSSSSEEFWLQKGSAQEIKNPLEVSEDELQIVIHTGSLQCVLNKSGKNLIESLKINGKERASSGYLVVIKEQRKEDGEQKVIRQIPLESLINKVEVERKGLIQCVVKIDGTHGEKRQFPFTVRLYFSKGTTGIKLVHTFFYDGHASEDFVKGIGLKLSATLEGQVWNRQIRIATPTGMYNEAAQLFLSRRHRQPEVYKKQIAGEKVDLIEIESSVLENAEGNAIWNDFKLIQQAATSCKVLKRTDKSCTWIDVMSGKKGKGFLYAGGEAGGVSISLKDFWQKSPSSLEVNHLGKSTSNLTIWFWSPDADAMDMRHYSEKTHVKSAYEGFDEMRSTPYGIANTSEAYINLYDEVPTNKALEIFADYGQEPALLSCEPEYYHETNALGIWSLPNRNHPVKAFLEDQLDYVLEFYLKEIEQRGWYGYWNYGDFMHTYDPIRHQWYYDMGGYAWQNTELVPNLWLWYSFFRTKRADVFKMAEAMARHTSEVDRYHFGEYAGLGSRHNVIHWGCGCKEARVSMAGLQKYYYFLTTDERMRDLLEATKDADQALDHLDPMREFYADDEFNTHARIGPDWSAFCSNWVSQWERTEEVKYKQKILVGLKNIKESPHKMLSGPTFGYNTKTSELHYMGTGNAGGYHMIIAFGAPQVWMEMAELLEDEELKDMLAEFGEVYLLSDEEKKLRSDGHLTQGKFNWVMFSAAIAAYASVRKKDHSLAKEVWDILLQEEKSGMSLPIAVKKISEWDVLEEIDWVTTNVMSQWCLNTIIALELIGDQIPDTFVG